MLYKTSRVGKNGKVFTLYKIKTLKDNSGSFASEEAYLPFGKFLRKTKLDELPQLWNWIKGDINIVGPRAEEKQTINAIQKGVRDLLLSIRPGMTSLASLHFFDEEKLLILSDDPSRDYWQKIKPIKIVLDCFYIQNRSWILDLAIIYTTLKKIIKSFFT